MRHAGINQGILPEGGIVFTPPNACLSRAPVFLFSGVLSMEAAKICIKCKKKKPISEFYTYRIKKDGLDGCCKSCKRIYQSKYRKTEKGKASQKRFSARYQNQVKAKWAVNRAIKAGKINKASSFKCKYCSKQARQYHHPSYTPENWLKVEPVCNKCHHECKKKIA